MTAATRPFTVKQFCDWWIGTVLLWGGPDALAVAYKTAAVLAEDKKLLALERQDSTS